MELVEEVFIKCVELGSLLLDVNNMVGEEQPHFQRLGEHCG